MRRSNLVLIGLLLSFGLAAGGCFKPKYDDSEEDASTAEDGTNGGDDTNVEDDGGGSATNKLDLLWVVDNSGSMCQEQRALREGFGTFLDKLTQTPVDLQTAVTTTHNIYATEAPPRRPFYDQHLFGPDQDGTEDSPLEPIAEAGQLQSTPHPTLGYTDSCHFAGSGGTLDKQDITPVKTRLSQAIACTKNPSQIEGFSSSNNFEQLTRCALADDCQNVSKSEDYNVADLVAEIFPCGQQLGRACETESDFDQVYRDIPRILRTEDYAGSNGILEKSEKEKLQKDFACMSFVGTHGSSFQQGLQNAALAVHPLMTGGPKGEPFEGESFKHPATGEEVTVENGADRPNHGFLRKDATTGLIFVTDSNDCSHPDHSILKRTTENRCGSINCYFPTAEESNNKDDLIGVGALYDRFVANLAKSRRLDQLSNTDLFVASLHGNPARYASSQHPSGDRHPLPQTGDKCGENGFPSQTDLKKQLAVCAGALGQTESGDRYARFVQRAKMNGYAAFPDAPLDPGSGAICANQEVSTALVEPLRQIASSIPVPR